MAGKKLERHWFIVRKRGDREIRCLISGFSPLHIRRKEGLIYNKDVIISKAKRWHVVRVFSGSPVFYDYKSNHGPEDVNAYVANEFHTLMDGEKILVKILS